MKTSLASRVGRNFLWLLIGDLASKVFLFIATVWIARKLTDAGFGTLSFAQAVLSYMIITMDMGLPIYGTREIAREPEKASVFAGNILGIRFSLAVILVVGTWALMSLLEVEPVLRWLIIFTSFWLFPWALNLEFAFTGLEKMRYASLGQFLFQFLFLISVVFTIHEVGDLLKVPLIRALMAMVVSIVLIYNFQKVIKTNFFEIFRQIDIRGWKKYIRDSFYLAASLIVIKIYYSFDTLMLGFYNQMSAVGWYNAAYRIIILFVTIASLLQTAFAPFFVKKQDRLNEFLPGVQKFAWVLMLSVNVITVFIFVFSAELIPIFFGKDYMNSIWILRYLSLSLLFIFADTVYLAPLLYTGGQKKYFISVLVGAVLNITLNLILIPRYSYYGAVIATILSNAVVFLSGAYFFTKIFRFDLLTFKVVFLNILACFFSIFVLQKIMLISPALSVVVFLMILVTGALIGRKPIFKIIQELI
jgi:O-antigen/teichoic acid export membrane protein